MSVTEERIDKIERAVQDFIVSVKESQMRTEAELREFKDEMRDYKEENRQQIRKMNITWGQMAKKLGTITEDPVAPGIPRIVKEEAHGRQSKGIRCHCCGG